MEADRFVTRRGFDPAGMGFALGMTGLVVLGMVYAAPKIVAGPINRIIDVINIPLDPPPPPPPPVQHQKAAPRPSQIQRVDPLIRAVTTDTPPIIDTVDVVPRIETVLPLGNGDGGVIVEPPKTPVLTDAAIDPRYAADFQPFYPPSERQMGREGRVAVRVLIGTDGRVHAVEPVSATSDAFMEATRRRALERWRFRPALRDGVAVESWRQMTVRFELAEQG